MPVTTTVSHGHTVGPQTTLTISHASDSYPLYVLLSWFVAASGFEAANLVTGITYNGVALTRGGQSAVEGDTFEWWRLGSPTPGTADLMITLSSGRRVGAAVLNLKDWPNTIAAHTFSALGFINQASMSINASSGNGAEVLDWIGYQTATTATTAGQTQLVDEDGTGSIVGGITDQVISCSLKAAAGASVTMSWSLSPSTETSGIAVLSFVPPIVSLPVEYEDPCDITEPRIFTKIIAEDETLKYGIHPLRDSAALGGFAEPRLVDVSPVTRAASDPSTGAWSAQTASTRFADTDRANRDRTETRIGFRHCPQEIYLTSNAQRLAGGPPRVLFSGLINADNCDENLVWSTAINDLIGDSYTLFAEEKQIPQRVIAITHFPNAPKDALGRGEPILGGRLAPANAANGEGVVDGIYVGQIEAGSSPGTPDAGTLAALVADMQAAADAGELDAQFGSRLGHGDCSAAEHTTIPSSEAALKAQFGTADIDGILQEYAATGGTSLLAVVFAGHAVKQVLNGSNGDPSIWINDLQIDPLQIGVSVTVETSYDIVGTDGETRRYFLLTFDGASDYGQQVAGGARVHLDCEGLEDVGDGSGTVLTDYFDLYRHVLINFLLQNYLTGAWLSTPQFLFSDGVTLLDRVDASSFTAAASVATNYNSTGYLGSFKIGDRTSIRTIIQNFNASASCLLGQDDYGRLFVKLLNPDRTQFLTNRGTLHRVLRDKVDFLPGFKIEPRPDWQVNRLYYQYASNYYTAQYERGEGGGGVAPVEDTAGQANDGVITKTYQLPYVRDDATALAVANYYVDLFGRLPRVVSYSRRGLCGLEDDILDGVPITHYNGYGANGWEHHPVWILSKTFDPKRMFCSFTALDVEARVT